MLRPFDNNKMPREILNGECSSIASNAAKRSRDGTAPVVAILIDNLHSYQKYICNSIDLVLKASGYQSIKVVLSNYDLERSDSEGQAQSLLSRLLHHNYIDGVIALNSSVGANMSS